MTRARSILERTRQSFWVLPSVGILAAVAAGVLLPLADDVVTLPDAVSFSGNEDTARTALQVIVTVAVSVAGISFSVIVVALVLASQQLSPRVLRSFQGNPLNQVVIGLFLGTAAFSLFVLGAVGGDPEHPVPELSVSLAMVLAGASFLLFVVFLHHLVRSLNASSVIRRIAADGKRAIHHPYPASAGREADDPEHAERQVQEACSAWQRNDVRAPRAGYLATVHALDAIGLAERCDGFVEQGPAIGEFVVTGAVLARVWCASARSQELASEVNAVFVLNEERIVDNDLAFPLRQLADVALKGLSPGINDPTTSENAMDSAADALVRLSREDPPTALRLDAAGRPRFRAATPSFDALVRLAFDQVRRDGARRPSFAVRLLELLAEIRECGGDSARASDELRRQALLVRDHACSLAEIDADRELVQGAYERLHAAAYELSLP